MLTIISNICCMNAGKRGGKTRKRKELSGRWLDVEASASGEGAVWRLLCAKMT